MTEWHRYGGLLALLLVGPLLLAGLGAAPVRAETACAPEAWVIETPLALEEGSGVGGTGYREGGEGSGLGGTGVGDGSGVGGTGVHDEGSGLGGTGIFGTITGLGSICVNGLHVHFDADAEVLRHDGGAPIDVDQLAVGQTVWTVAWSRSGRLLASRVDLLADVGGAVDEQLAADWIAFHTGPDTDLARLSVEGRVETETGWTRDRFTLRGLDLSTAQLSDAQRTALRERVASDDPIRILGRLRDTGGIEVERASPAPPILDRPRRIEPTVEPLDDRVQATDPSEPVARPRVRSATDGTVRSATDAVRTETDVERPTDLPETEIRPDPPEPPDRPVVRPDRAVERPVERQWTTMPDRLERPDRPAVERNAVEHEVVVRPERANRAPLPRRPPLAERPDRPEKPERPEMPERPQMPERPEKPERPDRPERPDAVERIDR